MTDVYTFPPATQKRAQAVLSACRERGLHLTTAESCTGGMLTGILTDIAGASDVVTQGFVTYSNEAKHAQLGVDQEMLATDGAVSEAAARAMAEGARVKSNADVAISITGVAGPGGGSAQKPVGLVHMACAIKNGPTRHQQHLFSGDRQAVRTASLDAALDLLLETIALPTEHDITN